MRILIAGASGFLGSNLAHSLTENYVTFSLVRRLSNKSRLEGSNTNIVSVEEFNSLEHMVDCLRPDVVINSVACYGRAGENISDTLESNLMFPQRLLEASLKKEVSLFINLGTSLPGELSSYSFGKKIFSDLLERQETEGIKIVNLKLEHFYGYKDDTSKFTSHVFDSCMNRKSLDLTKGTQKRDFIHVFDVVSAVDLIIRKFNYLNAFEVIEVGSGTALTIREFVELVKEITNSSIKFNFGVIPTRNNEVMHSCADISKLKKLGWEPQFDLVEGIKQAISGY
ncbi:NAD-dependent epimerase/dehydratase family protein [Agarilytica rhodophyticola]|uniref:NAD-dependent epimerase/dehydratase family protein n=1 Tax=Agarilytica rhodophyticola TaxID=1737490 RepID=UPI0013153EAB|nr:NAD(P)-dependent oxidoreductase [Agarilytica rhodophyticola]